MTAQTAAAPALDAATALAQLALLRLRLDLDSARADLLFEQTRRQIARFGPLYDDLAEAQAGDPEMTAALCRLASARRVAS